MENIIHIEGKVKFTITLDPGVWIFDDRRIDLESYFTEEKEEEISAIEKYTKNISKHWDREITEGAIHPPTLKTEKKFEKEKVLTSTFGIKLAPFIENAEPFENSSTVTFVSNNNEQCFSIKEAKEMIMKFSNKGKPLKSDGPVHIIYNNGSNLDNPIKGVHKIIIS
ncbi:MULTISPECIES: hypothetical protein [Bacillus]|uniref:hypothetical protein n=1 Tax=Bacillus TaxID=1386 RepID=UPI000BB98A03|nr:MULTISPECIES: hypothetical protein [Bacillus]